MKNNEMSEKAKALVDKVKGMKGIDIEKNESSVNGLLISQEEQSPSFLEQKGLEKIEGRLIAYENNGILGEIRIVDDFESSYKLMVADIEAQKAFIENAKDENGNDFIKKEDKEKALTFVNMLDVVEILFYNGKLYKQKRN